MVVAAAAAAVLVTVVVLLLLLLIPIATSHHILSPVTLQLSYFVGPGKKGFILSYKIRKGSNIWVND